MGNPEILVTLATQGTGQRLEKTQGQINNGQSRDTGSIGYTRHKTKVRENPRQIKSGQSRDTGNIGYTGHRTKVRENPRTNPEWVIQRHW
jgi:hypothetical protein